jgi:magnesium chelatase family protein
LIFIHSSELKVIKGEISPKTAFIGALALDGAVERADGMLAAIISAHSLGFERVYLPFDSTIPMQLLQNLDCIVVQHCSTSSRAGDVITFASTIIY